MADVFDSAWLKFGWAIRHEQQLKEENDRFVRADLALQEKVTYDAGAGELVMAIASIEPLPATISLILADALGCFRQCLDHVAWTMVRRGSQPTKESYFVIVDHPNEFDNAMAKRMPGISPADHEVVKGLHEHIWNAADPPGSEILKMRTLNNRDKHRHIQVVNVRPHRLKIYGELRDCTRAGPLRVVGDPELVSGQEFARIPVNKTGLNPNMRSTGRIETAPAVDGVPVVDLLNAVADSIHCLVLQRVQPEPPPEVYELGADLKPAND